MSSTLIPPRNPLRLDPLDPLDPQVRLIGLLDAGSIVQLEQTDGVASAVGLVDGLRTVVFAIDPRSQAGALGANGCALIVSAYRTAVAEGLPIVGIWQSGGARLTEGPLSLHAIGEVFAMMTKASGRIPQISIVIGSAAGGAAYGPALTDVVIMCDKSRIFVTGPDVVKAVTGVRPDPDALGGTTLHSRKSGVAHVLAADEASAMVKARSLIGLLRSAPSPARPAVSNGRPVVDPGELLPANSRRAYDVRPIVDAILDEPGIELHRDWAPNVVTTIGRLAGRPIGVVANNPLRKAGCLDATASDKAARFVRLCDTLGLALLVLVDVPGYLPGEQQESDGIVRRGAKLVHAFASATVPRVTVILRKAYGGAYIALNSRSLGATAVFAWPTAEVDVMSSTAAVGITHRRQIASAHPDLRADLTNELAMARSREVRGLDSAIDNGLIDEIIDPATTSARVAAAMAEQPPVPRSTHTNIPL